MVEMIGFDSRWQPLTSPKWLQHYCRLSMSRWNNVNKELVKSNGRNQAHCPCHSRSRSKFWRLHRSLLKIVRDRSVLKSSSPLKMLVNSLIFKISLLKIGRSWKTLFEHLLRRSFYYAWLLIQALQKTNFGFRANVFDSRVRKVNFNELSLWIHILRVKSSEDRYYLELKIEKIACLKNEKGKRWHI